MNSHRQAIVRHGSLPSLLESRVRQFAELPIFRRCGRLALTGDTGPYLTTERLSDYLSAPRIRASARCTMLPICIRSSSARG